MTAYISYGLSASFLVRGLVRPHTAAMARLRSPLALCLLFLLTPLADVAAREEFARETGKGCSFCHVAPSGGAVNQVGLAYARNGFEYPIPQRILQKSAMLTTPFRRGLHLAIWYLHMLAAAILIGTIFYVHVLIGPQKLISGIPSSEKVLGVACFLTLALTGVYLSWIRIDRFEQLITTSFGSVLFIKLLLFALMMASGITAITVVHRAMRRASKRSSANTSKITSLADLAQFDGREGRPALLAYEGKVFDVTGSEKWPHGSHFRKHQAGSDLTAALTGAPHGPEVLERFPRGGQITTQKGGAMKKLPLPARLFVIMAFANLALVLLILFCVALWNVGPAFTLGWNPKAAAASTSSGDCLACHRSTTPAIVTDWEKSVHALVGVDCYDCHKAAKDDPDILSTHQDYDPTPVAMVVSPKDCAACHPQEVSAYGRSKHANTIEIMWNVDHWLQDGMNNAIERTTGCYHCHGTVIELQDGRPVPGTWPNVGVGRKNPDGSLGSCTSCHTRHRFSVAEARKPEACDQCHLGPDHPQIEIYEESKHGTLYHAEGAEWAWRPDDGAWTAGRDYRAPTCAACHMSPASGVSATHDVTERLSWEAQAPLAVRPADFTPFPAATDWRSERDKMRHICAQCHSESWTDDHFDNYDRVIETYNLSYYTPIKQAIDDLYSRGLLDSKEYFDETLEWEFYEFWHHEGRRARMGTAMMAPDYAWWHGFYELKHRYRTIRAAYLESVPPDEAIEIPDFPGRHK